MSNKFIRAYGYTSNGGLQQKYGRKQQIGNVQTDKNAQFEWFAHYTDDRFRDPQTVYLAPGYKLTGDYMTVKGAGYNYSDRIWQWDWNKADEANKQVNDQFGSVHTAARYEAWLRLYFKNPTLELVHIVVGVNHSNGYHYHVYGYIEHTETQES